MKKYFCDICTKEFKWYKQKYQLGSYDQELEICGDCLDKITKFVDSITVKDK